MFKRAWIDGPLSYLFFFLLSQKKNIKYDMTYRLWCENRLKDYKTNLVFTAMFPILCTNLWHIILDVLFLAQEERNTKESVSRWPYFFFLDPIKEHVWYAKDFFQSIENIDNNLSHNVCASANFDLILFRTCCYKALWYAK